MSERLELLWRIERAMLSMQALGYTAEQIEKVLLDVFNHRPQGSYSVQELAPLVRNLEKRVMEAKRWILYLNSGPCKFHPHH
ncbi:hypothetical protein Desca_2046 [Desulfotomaculum nigrificans CO-1-SRB]|uniref:Uncharacterized protein n=1 Tax=Desulfotomaculum nigrificans (strain DSM 14880 / VKM B-2319 / CO-1-SRB) TaxID=868595 RepID=F6B9I9_DESCC|nr:hypothetical protein [Desulfotomaculum nigrificans]AEF94885.1 hypothetical protein Desca_2046 [Desulfotomaculum nigrificans CO-1-SRB]